MKITLFDAWKSMIQDVSNWASAADRATTIIAGHYAIDSRGQALVEEDDAFGSFSFETMIAGCEIVTLAKTRGRNNVTLSLLVDDHSQMPARDWYMRKDQFPRISKVTDNYFSNFELPEEYQELVKEFGLTSSDFLVSQLSGTIGFQESAYRHAFAGESGLDPGCSGEYRLILEELLQFHGIKRVLGFLPAMCQGPTCNALERYGAGGNSQLNVRHVYLATGDALDTREAMVDETIRAFGGIPVYHEKPGVKRS